MLHPKAQHWLDADKQSLWHPFTPMQQWLQRDDLADRLIVEAQGFELIDAHGDRYIDGFGSLWCNLHGHRVPQIDAAIRMQLDKAAHTTLLGYASPPSIELAARLTAIAPAGLARVFFSDSGATAVEVAVKMAYQYYQNLGQAGRRKFIAFRAGYHGDTIGAVSLGSVEHFHSMFGPLLFETTFVDTPNPCYNPAGPAAAQAVLSQIDDLLASEPQAYCGVFIEPLIQGAGGMLTQPPGFLKRLRDLTAARQVLLIADEVATGFCRTGKMFACDHEDVTPDIMCIGKGLTGGYMPVAATLATQRVFEAFLGEGRTFYHGHTFTGNALGCAAAVASIDLIASSGLLEALPAKVEYIAMRLAELQGHPHVGDIRQCGMMVGIDLVESRQPWRLFNASRKVASAVCNQARVHGLIIRPLEDVVVLMPAPAMDMATLARMMDGVIASVHEILSS